MKATLENHIGRREFTGLLSLAAPLLVDGVRVLAQGNAPLFPAVDLNHINIRVSNCGRSALFYHGLFGNDLLYAPRIPPNPSTPAVESWFVLLGNHFLSITPVFPHLKLGVDIDHIAPAVRGYTSPEAAAPVISARGLDTVSGNAGWIRDPEGSIYQLIDSGSSIAMSSFAQVLIKAGERQGTAFVPLAIRDITLRVRDLNTTGDFLATVFGGEVEAGDRRNGRVFRFGSSEIHLIPRAAGMSGGLSLDHFTIATKEFDAGSARRALQQRGVKAEDDGRGGVVFADPDGIRVRVTSGRR